jgi:hypothetical protein
VLTWSRLPELNRDLLITNQTNEERASKFKSTGCSHCGFSGVFDDSILSLIASSCAYLDSRHNYVTKFMRRKSLTGTILIAHQTLNPARFSGYCSQRVNAASERADLSLLFSWYYSDCVRGDCFGTHTSYARLIKAAWRSLFPRL